MKVGTYWNESSIMNKAAPQLPHSWYSFKVGVRILNTPVFQDILAQDFKPSLYNRIKSLLEYETDFV
jgi:hypothetical protein